MTERDEPDRGARDLTDRLRDALHQHAAAIEPAPGGLDRIEEKIMSEQTTDNTTRNQVLGAVAALLVAALVGVGALVALRDGGDDESDVVSDTSTTAPESDSTTTTNETSSTTETTATTAPFAPDVDPYSVAYPSPLTSQRFQSPESAAQSYATEVLGFTELEMGEFQQGDSRSGELAITDGRSTSETVIVLRQMEDDTWYALASITDDIVVDDPAAGDEISSPFTTTGEALAFEGTVDVLVRAQDDPAPIGEGFVTGSGVPPAGPFEGEITFTAPTAETPGIVVYRELSAEDGHVVKATSFPVRLLP